MRTWTGDGQVSPWTSLHAEPLGSPDKEILEVAEQVYRAELAVAPSILPNQWQDWCMRELCWELHRCMARASLQSDIRMAQSSSRSRCLCSHSTPRACSPSSRHRGMEAAKWLKEDAPAGQSEVRRHSHSRGRDRSKQHQSPSPQCLSRCQSPSPSPPWSCPVAESRSRTWWDDTSTPAEKQKKQVRFDEEGDLDNDPTLPPGLTLFLVEGSVEEWDNTPGTVTPVHEEPLLPPPSKSLQCCHTHTGGVRPKTLAHPSADQS